MDGTAFFWGEMAPCEHLVQIYEDDDSFLDKLEGFVASGLDAGESVVVIATPGHLSSLHRRLLKRGPEMAATMRPWPSQRGQMIWLDSPSDGRRR